MNFFDKKIDLNKRNVTGLTSELKGYYLYKKYAESKDSVLFVTSNLYEANSIYQTILNYTDKVLFFPMDDFLTSEALAISPEFLSYRLDTLNKLLDDKYIVVTNLMGYLRFLPNRETYKQSIINIKVGDNFDIKSLVKKLYTIGYERETVVSMSGHVAIRGFILDIFPFESNNPIRIEFFDDEIEKISEFDVNTQLRNKYIDEIKIYPTTELIVREDYEIKYHELPKYISCSNIYEYMDKPIVFFNDYDEIFNSYKILSEEMTNYKQDNLFDKNIKFMYELDEIKSDNVFYFDRYGSTSYDYKTRSINNLNWNNDAALDYLEGLIVKKYTIIIAVNNKITKRKVAEKLSKLPIVETSIDNIIENKINIVVQKMNSGFEFDNYIVISEKELFNKKDISYIYKTKFRMGNKIRDINKLEKGDYIVHYVHGIGIYQGIKTLKKNGMERDYIMLEYKNRDKLYVPVEKIDLISKYSSKEDHTPTINKLGSTEWSKTKLKAKKRAEKIAIDLLKLYSEREAANGFAFFPDTEAQTMFEVDFPYQETDDQLKAAKEIKEDMEKNKPMDRLLVGDVGYGKTEVAFRAIFKAIMSHKQAVILCPTTILSQQHYQNALERFKSFDVEIELLNRFVTPKKQKDIIERLKEGKIDLLIGTHRVLGNDVVFKNLGLLIIDEEQRFGVKHKEKIKEYKNNIDVLTLSATPIPRTYALTIYGDMDLSIIKTVPSGKKEIITKVYKNDKIKDVLSMMYEELKKKNQIYVIAPLALESDTSDLSSVYELCDKMNKAFGKIASIGIMHGKLDSKEKDSVMDKFKNKEIDILVSTTVIEVGVDVKRATMIVIFDAQQFGLSTLHQLRGRVGRNDLDAYCLLISDKDTERLKIMEKTCDGFKISEEDFKIRGSGDLFGIRQSGDMKFKLANLKRDYKLLLKAKEDSLEYINKTQK